MDAHIFVDNSNIFGGAQRAAGTKEPDVVWLAVRLYYRNFFQLIERGFNPVTRVLAGSVPPGNDDLWEYARHYNYNTDLLHKIERDNGRLVEQGVDEILHLKIANALLDYDPPQLLILCTGDAKESDFGTSFKHQATRAIRRGWQVRVWSWQDQLSRAFQREIETSKGALTITKLDDYYREITYVQAGDYYYDGVKYSVKKERIVSKLAV